MGMMRGMDSYNMQEKTGEAYVLYPSAVTIDLKPWMGGRVAPPEAVTPHRKPKGVERAGGKPERRCPE